MFVDGNCKMFRENGNRIIDLTAENWFPSYSLLFYLNHCFTSAIVPNQLP
jgi:hypothetical protein